MSDAAPEERIDGRRQRTQVTRANIVNAAISLQNEGNMRPSMQQIAERAGVSLRTAFQHFPEKHQLTHAVLDELTRLNRVDPPPPELATHSALDARIEKFLEIRCRQLEGLTPHRRAVEFDDRHLETVAGAPHQGAPALSQRGGDLVRSRARRAYRREPQEMADRDRDTGRLGDVAVAAHLPRPQHGRVRANCWRCCWRPR